MKRKNRLLSASLLSFGILFAAGAQSQSFATTFNVMHNFGGTDGDFPQATLAMDGSGNFYGTTSAGSAGGVVYELTPSGTSWTQTVLWTFCAGGGSCSDGTQPTAPVIVDTSGNLYGTTSGGGANGKGTVFKLTHTGSTWSESVLYSFGATASDGATPMSRLTYAGASSGALYPGTGALYGTTNAGGSGAAHSNLGTVYSLKKVSGVWTETVLYNFCGVDAFAFCDDGAQPGTGGVTLDSAGHLYGIAGYGQFDNGLLYELIKTGSIWGQTPLYSFCSGAPNCSDGKFGTGSNVIIDSTGAIIGTMDAGGDYTNVSDGGGVVFKYSGGTMQVLYAFCQIWDSASGECKDGQSPSQGGSLVLDSSGNLYGTTLLGGGPNPNDPGQAYWLDTSNVFHSLHKFCARTNCSDGEFPEGGLIMDASGNLYGTAYNGGTGSQHGTVYQIIP